MVKGDTRIPIVPTASFQTFAAVSWGGAALNGSRQPRDLESRAPIIL